jgi:hypothetical protein
VLPHSREVVGEENSDEVLGGKGYRSLGKMLQGPVRYTVRVRSLADFDNALNLVSVG